ncbi:hypothetical protein H0H93_010598 [Arthromyces matolae]|nr:hypothetical protein H0H93_010598 [Arthromyces matolae]
MLLHRCNDHEPQLNPEPGTELPSSTRRILPPSNSTFKLTLRCYRTMLVMSGYSMSYEVAKAWALRRWPDIVFGPQEDFIPACINGHYNKVEQDREKVKVVPIIRDGKSYCLFSRRCVIDPAATAVSFKFIRETEEDKAFVHEHFPEEVARKEVHYMIVSDPYEAHYTNNGPSVIKVRLVKPPRGEQKS